MDLIKLAELTDIATYAAGIGPDRWLIVPTLSKLDSNDEPIDINRDGQISDADQLVGQPTTLVSRFQILYEHQQH